MQNYVALYGFLRTMTLISTIFFWSAIWHFTITEFTIIKVITVLFFLSLVSFIFYMAFVKFWARFTLETLMALTATHEVKPKIDPETLHILN